MFHDYFTWFTKGFVCLSSRTLSLGFSIHNFCKSAAKLSVRVSLRYQHRRCQQKEATTRLFILTSHDSGQNHGVHLLRGQHEDQLQFFGGHAASGRPRDLHGEQHFVGQEGREPRRYSIELSWSSPILEPIPIDDWIACHIEHDLVQLISSFFVIEERAE